MKHRGKRIDTGEWVYGFLISDSEIRVYEEDKSVGFYTHEDFEVDPKTVGMCTGKNDTYSGDVFKDHNGHTWVIEYSEINAAFIAVDTWKFHQSRHLNFCDIVEVLGNIHDSPKLLER